MSDRPDPAEIIMGVCYAGVVLTTDELPKFG